MLHRLYHPKFVVAFVLGLLSLGSLRPAAAQERDLHIETFIYGARDKVVSENLTLFTRGRVYDFRRDPSSHEVLEIAVYDPQRQQFDLFDVVGRRRMTVREQEILDMLALLVSNPDVTKRDPMLFDPREMEAMEEDYDPATGWITLTSRNGRLTYRAHGSAPRNPDALGPYVSFVDWYSRLNGTNPHRMPPFARLQLNKRLLRYGILPDEIELDYSPPGLLGNDVAVKSKHFVTWGLNPSDQALIEDLTKWVELPRVEMAQYYSPAGAERR